MLVQPGQLQVWPRNLLCRWPAQLEQKSLGVSDPRLATAEAPHIPARGAEQGPRRHIPAPDPENSARGGQEVRDPWKPLGLLASQRRENRARLPICSVGTRHFALPVSRVTVSSHR